MILPNPTPPAEDPATGTRTPLAVGRKPAGESLFSREFFAAALGLRSAIPASADVLPEDRVPMRHDPYRGDAA